jgi:hypothetical protein
MAVIVMQSAKWGNETVEYKTAAAGSIDSSALEKFGRDGWRLVCVDSATGYIFTR